MATSTVLRVKRRLEDNPQDALVLLCKRMKAAETEPDDVSPSLFVFRGTVDNTDSSHVKTIVPKSSIKLKASHNVDDIIQKIRKERKEIVAENRYEVVNCSRGLQESGEKDIFDLVDLQQKADANTEVKYAYDLYTALKEDFDFSMIDDLVGIENYETNLVLGSYRDNNLGSAGTSDGESSDDSNDENNWRNDYPDSEHSSIDEEDIVRAVQRCDLENDLSSDEGEDRIYDEPSAVFQDDVQRYGEAYARYKARVLSEDQPPPTSLIHSSKITKITELSEDPEGYKDDSDDGFYYGEDEDTQQFREQYHLDESSDGPD